MKGGEDEWQYTHARDAGSRISVGRRLRPVPVVAPDDLGPVHTVAVVVRKSQALAMIAAEIVMVPEKFSYSIFKRHIIIWLQVGSFEPTS